jgi:hypothetical protein
LRRVETVGGVADTRMSVSSWKTAADDINRSLDAILGVLPPIRDPAIPATQ